MNRGALVNNAVCVAVGGGIYGGCAEAAAVAGYPPPVSGVVVLGLLWTLGGAVNGAADAAMWARRVVRRVRHAREVAHRDALHEHYGIGYRVGSPPSHRVQGI